MAKRRHTMVSRTGFEPMAYSLEGCCSIQLSYRDATPIISACLGSGCKRLPHWMGPLAPCVQKYDLLM